MQQHQQQSHQRHTTKRIKRQQTERNKIWACLLLSSFALLLTLWLVAVTHYVMTMISSSAEDTIIDGGSSVQSALFNNERQPPSSINPPSLVPGDDNTDNTTSNLRRKRIPSNTIIQQPPKLLSRNPKVILTTSTRGNLGPPTVLNQNPPGNDWIKDRWQAASDMHGTAIKGSHWVLLDFSQLVDEEKDNGNDLVGDGRRGVQMTKIVLDWETAFATDYRVEGRMDRPLEHDSSLNEVEKDEWCLLYDGGNANNINQGNNELQRGIETQFHESSYGQSPGVKQKLPLHILHTIEWMTSSLDNNEQTSEGNDGSDRDNSGSCQTTTAFRYLRIFIRKPARGWGVSLWEVDVYGTIVNR